MQRSGKKKEGKSKSRERTTKRRERIRSEDLHGAENMKENETFQEASLEKKIPECTLERNRAEGSFYLDGKKIQNGAAETTVLDLKHCNAANDAVMDNLTKAETSVSSCPNETVTFNEKEKKSLQTIPEKIDKRSLSQETLDLVECPIEISDLKSEASVNGPDRDALKPLGHEQIKDGNRYERDHEMSSSPSLPSEESLLQSLESSPINCTRETQSEEAMAKGTVATGKNNHLHVNNEAETSRSEAEPMLSECREVSDASSDFSLENTSLDAEHDSETQSSSTRPLTAEALILEDLEEPVYVDSNQAYRFAENLSSNIQSPIPRLEMEPEMKETKQMDERHNLANQSDKIEDFTKEDESNSENENFPVEDTVVCVDGLNAHTTHFPTSSKTTYSEESSSASSVASESGLQNSLELAVSEFESKRDATETSDAKQDRAQPLISKQPSFLSNDPKAEPSKKLEESKEDKKDTCEQSSGSKKNHTTPEVKKPSLEIYSDSDVQCHEQKETLSSDGDVDCVDSSVRFFLQDFLNPSAIKEFFEKYPGHDVSNDGPLSTENSTPFLKTHPNDEEFRQVLFDELNFNLVKIRARIHSASKVKKINKSLSI